MGYATAAGWCSGVRAGIGFRSCLKVFWEELPRGKLWKAPGECKESLGRRKKASDCEAWDEPG